VRVLVTGSDGYIGSVLVPILAERGHEVSGLDTGFYRDGLLYGGSEAPGRVVRKDIRRLTAADLEGFDAVVHLAELANDPLALLAPSVTHEINYAGSLRVATLAKATGVPRFVYMSSCSVYGVATTDEVTEDSPVNPLTPYAQCKALVERDVGAMADDDFSPTFLRSATVFGASPRMRFDLAVNNLSGVAWTTGVVRLESDGTAWRPFIQVRDVSRAISFVLDAPRDAVHNQILNVGSQSSNSRILDVAHTVASVFDGSEIAFASEASADTRSYRVSFDKLAKTLPSFSCQWTVERGARELREVFDSVRLTADRFSFRGFTRLAQIEHLRRTEQIDQRFFWRE
jgi:nucleoside-diphosphate-sugar epimerase